MDLFSSLYSFEFCSLASGSSGNCYYIGNQDGAILVDVGLGARKIGKLLQEVGKSIHSIKGILITHDHIDHIKGVEALTRQYKIPVYTSSETWNGIKRNRFTKFSLDSAHQPIEQGIPFIIGSFTITAFPVSHDAKGAMGYYVQNSHQSISVATDLGIIGEEAAFYMQQANVMVLESNYDDEMLTNGPYPAYLQERIRGDFGHLSNQQTADFLVNAYRKEISHIFLAHLSKQNNLPEKVLQTIKNTFEKKGVIPESNTLILPLERLKRSPLYRIY